MWNRPQNAEFVNERTYGHPADRGGLRCYYRLIRFTNTGRYALLGMGGEVRTVDQTWAREARRREVGG